MRNWRSILLVVLIPILLGSVIFVPHKRRAWTGGVPNKFPRLKLWLKSDVGTYNQATNTPPADNEEVRWWLDQSGSVNDFKRTTSFDVSPTNRSNQIDGKPWVEFNVDAVSERLPIATGTVDLGSNNTVCILGRVDAVGTSQTDAIFTGSVDQLGVSRSGGVRSMFYTANTEVLVGPTIQEDLNYLFTWVKNGGTVEYYTNGVSGGTDAVTSTNEVDFSQISGNGFFDGFLAEVVMYDTNYGGAELKLLFTYFRNRYPSIPIR